MQKIAAVIFDMDGVLSDSQSLHVQAELETCAHFDIEVTQDFMESEAGKPDNTTFLELATKNGHLPEEAEKMMQYKYDVVMPRILEEKGMPAIVGSKDVVQFATKNFPCAVASSATHEFIDFVMGHLKLDELLPIRISNDDLTPGHGKPNPDIFLLAAEKLDVEPEQCIVIEDAALGAHAAKAAGMFCIGFNSPHSGMQDLSEADWMADNMKEVLKILQETSNETK